MFFNVFKPSFPAEQRYKISTRTSFLLSVSCRNLKRAASDNSTESDKLTSPRALKSTISLQFHFTALAQRSTPRLLLRESYKQTWKRTRAIKCLRRRGVCVNMCGDVLYIQQGRVRFFFWFFLGGCCEECAKAFLEEDWPRSSLTSLLTRFSHP